MEVISNSLYLVPTPIGNLSELSARALFVLKNVDYIFCEDTRNTLKLLNHFDFTKHLISLHEHNEQTASNKVIDFLKEGKSIAYVSDAGTPLISDPGSILVNKVREANYKVIPLSGPSALINALVGSGFDITHFYFQGFLSLKSSLRKKELLDLSHRLETIVIYESPHKFMETIKEFIEVFKERKICVCRELTKIYEEFFIGNAPEILQHYQEGIKGEIVLVIENQKKELIIDDALLLKKLSLKLKTLSAKDAIEQLSQETQIAKNYLKSLYLGHK
ncbi:MAG: 16S rRNA (cytidine(1402)-2'-O)-methyltransferase [Bacillales bacterium]|jgi:16S rRNA (cytidine1402-2'-O)-methyltransferase|nr:16S rRNA (cytidine(1402)-2'-O)-methyltransferase [Bacillales bacterium]